MTFDPGIWVPLAGMVTDGTEIPRRGNKEGSYIAVATYTITGMTCGHCVNAVSTELGRLVGVTDVQVDLAAGTATVTSEQPLEPEAVRAAVDEAGYEVAS